MNDDGLPTRLQRTNIGEYARRLTEPFTMIDLAQMDELVLSIYLCQGTVPYHRHVDQDELFLVHTGTISLESDWGTLVLRPGELAAVPKGLGHRSVSLLPSLVLLLQPRLMVNRRNGDRRLFALGGQGRIEKVSVRALGRHIAAPFSPVLLAHVDTYALNLTLCQGQSPLLWTDRQTSLVLCYDGSLAVVVEQEETLLESGELVVIPRGLAYRMSGDWALALSLQGHDSPGLPSS